MIVEPRLPCATDDKSKQCIANFGEGSCCMIVKAIEVNPKAYAYKIARDIGFPLHVVQSLGLCYNPADRAEIEAEMKEDHHVNFEAGLKYSMICGARYLFGTVGMAASVLMLAMSSTVM